MLTRALAAYWCDRRLWKRRLVVLFFSLDENAAGHAEFLLRDRSLLVGTFDDEASPVEEVLRGV